MTQRSAKRRGRDDGALFWDASRGVWTGVVDIGRDPVTHKRLRRKVSAATQD